MSQIPCPNCGAPVDSADRACPYCGAAQSTSAGQPAPAARAQALPAYSNSAEAMDAIKDELRSGSKIQAIQLHRNYFSTSLAEARDAVEQIEANLQFESAPPPQPEAQTFPVEEGPKSFNLRPWLIGCGIAAAAGMCLCVLTPLALAAIGIRIFGQ